MFKLIELKLIYQTTEPNGSITAIVYDHLRRPQAKLRIRFMPSSCIEVSQKNSQQPVRKCYHFQALVIVGMRISIMGLDCLITRSAQSVVSPAVDVVYPPGFAPGLGDSAQRTYMNPGS